MAKLKVKGLKKIERGARTQPTPGLYKGKITAVDEAVSAAGNDMLVVKLKITNRSGPQKEFKGATLRTHIVTSSEASAWKLAEFLDACDVTNGGKKDAVDIDTDELVGTELQFKVEGGTYNGEYSASVGLLLPLSAKVDDEEDEEEADDEGEDDEPEEEEDDDEGDDGDDDEDEDEEGDDDEEEVDLDEMTLPELRKFAKANDIKLKKDDKAKATRAKIRAALAEAEDDEEEDDYNDWSPKDLATEAEARGLEYQTKAGKTKSKAALVKLLLEDDDAAEDPFS